MDALAQPSPAGLERMRAGNLARVLRLVHNRGGLSRAALTRETGLNRSTVGSLVAELVARDLVVEGAAAQRAQVGRPSLLVQPSEHTVAVAVHPEVDAIEVGLVALGGTLVDRRRVALASAPTAAEAVTIATAGIDELRAAHPQAKLLGVGVAVPGMVKAADGVVRLAPHLDWHDEPIAAMLSASTGLSVHVANDASVGAQAEAMFGAGRASDFLVYLNGGASGIGGGIIAGGALYGGIDGYAGEFGHVAPGGRGDNDLEDEVARHALLDVLGLPSGRSGELAAALLASRDDERVMAVVHAQQRSLARALRNVVNVLNPELIVLGGFLGALMAAAPESLYELLAEQALAAPLASVTLVQAALGDELLMVGAAELVVADLIERLAGGA